VHLYGTVRSSSTAIHQDVLAWARERLRLADLYGVECLGQLPVGARTDPALILLPFRVGADPKLADVNNMVLPLGQGENEPARAQGAPEAWIELAAAIHKGFQEFFPGLGRRPVNAPPNMPVAIRMPVQDLPGALQSWYHHRAEGWVQEGHARLPRLGWLPGIPLLIRYLALSAGQLPDHDPTTSAPLGVPSLAVLSAAILRERFFEVNLPIPSPPSDLSELIMAMHAALESRGLESPIQRLYAQTEQALPQQVAIMLQGDIANHELVSLLQALHQPLQSAMSFQLRFQIGGEVVLRPGATPGEGPRR